MNIDKLFEISPHSEVLMRNLYWRIPTLSDNHSANRRRSPGIGVGFRPDDLVSALRRQGVAVNDTIIVHSSMTQVAQGGLSPLETFQLLTLKLCPEGTIVCPTFPIYRDEPKGRDRLNKDISSIVFEYNVQRTRPWTGELGRVLMNTPGARRSLHPLNTVAVYGADVDKIFAKEFADNLDLPCGPSSTWAALVNLNAKIIMLGVDMAHSLTMIHVAEDCYENEWPVKDWYRKRICRIIDRNKEYLVEVRERHPKWALSYAERKLSKDLYALGIASEITVGGLKVTVLESKVLIEYLNSKKRYAYPYYMTWLSRV